MGKFKEFYKKFRELYKEENFSKGLIISTVILTALVAFFTVDDNISFSFAFWSEGQFQSLPETGTDNLGTDNLINPKFRACIWEQNTIKSCEPIPILSEIFDNNVQLADEIRIIPVCGSEVGGTCDPNADGTRFSGFLVLAGGTEIFTGYKFLASSPKVTGTNAYDFALGGVPANRNDYDVRIDLARNFPSPVKLNMTNHVNTPDGNSETTTSFTTLFVEGLGPMLANYFSLAQHHPGLAYSREGPFNGIPIQFYSSEGYGPENDKGDLDNDIPSVTTPDTYFITADSFFSFLNTLSQDIQIAVAGSCNEFDQGTSQYQSAPMEISKFLEEFPEDTLPNKEYITNAGEIYSFGSKEEMCEEYLSNDNFNVTGIAEDDYFDIACKPECEECETKDCPTFQSTDLVSCIGGGFGRPCDEHGYCEVFGQSNEFECDNGGGGWKSENIVELRNTYGDPDPDYDGDICKVTSDRSRFIRHEEDGEVVCKTNDDAQHDDLEEGKVIPDRELVYWNSNTRSDGSGGEKDWCYLNHDETTELSKIADVNAEIDSCELPAAAGVAFHSLLKLNTLIPDDRKICLNENIGSYIRTKLGVLNTEQCELYREITGNTVTAYYTLEQLVQKQDLPFNQGAQAQMCSPERRIEPACSGQQTPAVGEPALVQIPVSPTENGFTRLYCTFPFMGNVVDLEQAYSRVLYDYTTKTLTDSQKINYLDEILPTFNAHVCGEGEIDILTRYLIERGGYLTIEQANDYGLTNLEPASPGT